MKLVYTDPKKKKLQQIEMIVVLLFLPVGLFYGWGAFADWQNFRQAEKLFQEASEIMHQGKYKEATPKLEAALEAYPEYYAVWEELGVSYHFLGEHQKEMETYLKGTEALPENGNLHRELAFVYHELGEHEKELASAKRAVELPNSDPLFTLRTLQRAEKEASGEVVVEELERSNSNKAPHDHEASHDHDHTSDAASPTPNTVTPTP